MFISPLEIEELPRPDYWLLTAPLVWIDPEFGRIAVPRGWITDLASIPGLLRNIPALDINGPSRAGAALHDFLYGSALLSRADSDQRLRLALLAEGCSELDAELFYMGVRSFGWHAWDEHRAQGAGAVLADFATPADLAAWIAAGAALASGAPLPPGALAMVDEARKEIEAVEVHLYLHVGDDLAFFLNRLIRGVEAMTPEFQALTDAVTAETTAEASLETLVVGLFNQLGPNPTPAEVSALKDQVTANIATINAAVLANTPAAPPPAGGATIGTAGAAGSGAARKGPAPGAKSEAGFKK